MEEHDSKRPISSHYGNGRRIGYFVTIIVLLVVMYVFNHLYIWGVSFLTEDYNAWLFYFQMSIYASIAIHAVFLVYDSRWFRHLLKAAANVFSALSAIMLYVIFPIYFASDTAMKTLRIVLLVIMILSIVSILVELVKAVKLLRTVSQD
jgi:hypothetical protein